MCRNKINVIIIFTISLIFLSAYIIIPNILFANTEPIDENNIFNDSETVISEIEQQNILKVSDKKLMFSTNSALSKTEIKFSGDIQTRVSYYSKSSKSKKLPTYQNLNNYSEARADFLFDARIEDKIKTFLNLEVSYSPQTDSYLQSQKIANISANKYYNDILIKEFFLDANISRKIYFRFGRQFLQWGRCFFWQPADLINIEHKSFDDLNKRRTGVFGLRVHIPYKTLFNYYNFIDLSNQDNTNDIAVTNKFEFLIKRSELAVSIWLKNKYKPIYTFDISSRISSYDIRAELTASKSAPNYTIDLNNNMLYKKNNYLRAALNIGRSFNYKLPDRITANLEFFYNRNGYTDNVFTPQFWAINNTQKIYEMNYHSKYYLGFFSSFNRFIIENCNLNFNALTNLNDKSYNLATGVNYSPYYNFKFDFYTYLYAGGVNKEYTLSGNRLSFDLRATLSF